MDTNSKKDLSGTTRNSQARQNLSEFVLEKSIFSRIFTKDIRRVYIYKKAERLAKAVHLICPAFSGHPAFKDKIDRIALALVEAAVQPQGEAREEFARELLTLSSVLSIAETGGILSKMNAELVASEARALLEEVATYEEPKVLLGDGITLAELMRTAQSNESLPPRLIVSQGSSDGPVSKGHIKDRTSRTDSVLAILKSKGPSYIKDISILLRDISEKTIQRELQSLVLSGKVKKEGDRRWTRYSAV